MLVTVLVASSLLALTVAPAIAQAGFKPSVPQFTVKLIDNSHDIPPSTTTSTNPYTGEETTDTNSGRHVVDKNIEITIKNQPFTPYKDADGYEHTLVYQVEFKGRFEDEQGWKLVTTTGQSDSQYTTITVPQYNLRMLNVDINSLPTGSQLDFRVNAITRYDKPRPFTDGDMFFGYESVVDTSSGWSGVQTITISDKSQSSPLSQTTTLPPVNSDGNSQPQPANQTQPPNSIFSNPLFTLVVGVLLGGIIVAVVLVVLRRHIKTPTYNSTQTNTNTEPLPKLADCV
ncbi:MAG: hypothetical protein FWG55_04575 [Candidatus Bathyarchaeota archaeon]|nr:hypothetical protein [Candidatus Termiticorpusculum sp.]